MPPRRNFWGTNGHGISKVDGATRPDHATCRLRHSAGIATNSSGRLPPVPAGRQLMREDGRPAEAEIVGARALREWITGERDEYSRVFLVDGGAATAGVAEVAGRDDVILLPEAGEPYGGLGRAVRYSGAWEEIGDELFFGTRAVELQDYVAAAFVQIVGPTAVCFTSAAGWHAFLVDADIARDTGVFPSALIDPRVILAGRTALARPGEPMTPTAIRVRSDGRVSVGVRGEVIGSVDDLPTLLTIPLPRVAALGGIAAREELTADLTCREWIERYLDATDLIKMLRFANGAAKLSGFGWSLVEDGLADAQPLTADPFLLETCDGFLLADIRTLRRQLLSPVTARVVAVIQTSSAPEVATERVSRLLGTPPEEANRLCLDAVGALDVRFGRRAGASRLAQGIHG